MRLGKRERMELKVANAVSDARLLRIEREQALGPSRPVMSTRITLPVGCRWAKRPSSGSRSGRVHHVDAVPQDARPRSDETLSVLTFHAERAAGVKRPKRKKRGKLTLPRWAEQ